MKMRDCTLYIRITLLIVIVSVALITCYSVFSLKQYIIESSDDERFMESMYIHDNILSSIRINNQTVDLEDLKFKSPKLICFYSAQTCESCVQFATKKIKEYFSDIDTNSNVLFVAFNYSDKIKLKQKNVLKLGKRRTGTDLDDLMHVCYFIIQNGEIEHFFIPEKNYPDFTDLYLKEIQRKYF